MELYYYGYLTCYSYLRQLDESMSLSRVERLSVSFLLCMFQLFGSSIQVALPVEECDMYCVREYLNAVRDRLMKDVPLHRMVVLELLIDICNTVFCVDELEANSHETA